MAAQGLHELGAEVPYLPRLLKEAGYATGGAVSAFVLRGATGLADGFDFYQDEIVFRTGTDMGGLQRPGAETLARSRDWLRGAAGGPFFYFLHLYDPHTPYAPPEPFASRHASAYDGEIAAADAVVGELLAELDRLDLHEIGIHLTIRGRDGDRAFRAPLQSQLRGSAARQHAIRGARVDQHGAAHRAVQRAVDDQVLTITAQRNVVARGPRR